MFATTSAFAETDYTAVGFVDFSGPFANIYPDIQGGREAVLAWWNKEVGAGLGVKISLPIYDIRYDPAQAASVWPSAKAEHNPIILYGVGGPDAAALQERLPDDKVPMFMSGNGYGYSWKPGSWVIGTRPTFAHELGAFLDWYETQLKRPVRFALVTSDASPGFVDIARGLESFAKDNPKVELIEVIYTQMQPADLTLEVRRVVNAKADIILTPGSVAQIVAVKRALESLGAEIPVVTEVHAGLTAASGALGDPNALNGDYEVCACALAVEGETPARAFYDKLAAEYGLKSQWSSNTILGMGVTLASLRLLEKAIAETGADKVTGESIRNMLESTELDPDQTFGIYPTLKWSAEAPFPVTGAATISVMKDGKITLAAEGSPLPAITKW